MEILEIGCVSVSGGNCRNIKPHVIRSWHFGHFYGLNLPHELTIEALFHLKTLQFRKFGEIGGFFEISPPN